MERTGLGRDGEDTSQETRLSMIPHEAKGSRLEICGTNAGPSEQVRGFGKLTRYALAIESLFRSSVLRSR